MFATASFRSLAIIAPLFIALVPGAALAQDGELSAARAAVTATDATGGFDNILPNASTALKNQLTAQNPDQAERIATVVDEEALALAVRRGDLETEAARLFANNFTADELKMIAEFFGSPTGKKYLDATPILARELSRAARTWAGGITRDLRENVNKKLAAGN